MKIILFFLAFFLTGCFEPTNIAILQTLQNKKDLLTYLEEKLQKAEKINEETKVEILMLQKEIDEAKIAFIREHIDDFKGSEVSSETLFRNEREELYKMIQKRFIFDYFNGGS